MLHHGTMTFTTFQTEARVAFQVEEIDFATAEYVGCPEANHRIIGPNTGTVTYGYFMATGTTPGQEVRVPGWTAARKGARAVFVPAVLDGWTGTTPIDGWVAR